MSTELVNNEVTGSTCLSADVTDDSCRTEFIEIVPLPGDTNDPSTTEYDSADRSAEVEQEILPVVKQEPDQVLFTVIYINCC